MKQEKVKELVEGYLKETPYYLVKVSVNADEVEVLIDTPAGVDMDFCAGLNRHLQEQLAPEIDQYNLLVGSAGLTEPMVVPQQFMQNIGNPVEVLTLGGEKLHGTLTDATDTDFEIEWTCKEKVEGQKRKIEVSHQARFTYPAVKYCVYDLKV